MCKGLGHDPVAVTASRSTGNWRKKKSVGRDVWCSMWWWSWMGIEIRLVLTVDDGWERETDEDGTAVTVVDGDPSWSSVLRSGEFACSNFQTIHLAQPNRYSTPTQERAATGTGAPGQALQGLQGRTQQTEQAAFPEEQHAACDEKAHGAHPYWHLRARQSAAELPRKAALDWLRCRYHYL